MSMKSIFMWNFGPKRTVFLDVIQGILIGAGLAFITIFIFPKAYVTKVNGWTTMYGCGEPGNGILFRSAPAEQCVLVADDGGCEKSLCG
ncbi:MAG: hypothetical protein ABSG01_16840 [Anaerolineales bacterium]